MMRSFLIILTVICNLFSFQSFAQQPGNLSITGTIGTADGKPVSLASIQMREARKGTTTNEQGHFTIDKLQPGTYTLVISFVGLETIEKPVTVDGEKAIQLSIEMKEIKDQLQEVVVLYNQTVNHKVSAIGKAGIKPMDLPQSVAIIGEGLIRDQQAQRLSDVIKNVNGVYLATARASTQETFFARGYSFSSTNMFKNGSRVNTGAMPEVSSLESVEILKGGAAILYGNVAPGGILNMVTKKPKFEFGGEASLRAGSYNLIKPAIDIYGPVSGKIAYRVNGTFESADSYRDQVSSKRYYVNPSLLFNLGKRTELIVEGDYLRHEFTPDF